MSIASVSACMSLSAASIRSGASCGTEPAEGVPVMLDLGGEALHGLVMPLRLFFRRPGAPLDLGQVTTAAGECFVGERVRFGRCGLFGVVAGLTDGGLESRPRRLRLGLRRLSVASRLLGLGEYCRAGSI